MDKVAVRTAVICALAFTMPGLAEARGVSAFKGIASTPSEANCWSHSAGAITNNCSAARRWCMPLDVDYAGTHNVSVSVYAAAVSKTVGCFAVGLSSDLSNYWQSPQYYTSVYGSTYSIGLSVYTPTGGVLYACCDVNPGGSILTVNWSI